MIAAIWENLKSAFKFIKPTDTFKQKVKVGFLLFRPQKSVIVQIDLVQGI